VLSTWVARGGFPNNSNTSKRLPRAGPGAGVPAAALHLHADTPLLAWHPSVLCCAPENQPQSGSDVVEFGGEQACW